MSKAAITVENLSKAYRIGLREEIPDTVVAAAKGWVSAPWRNFRRLKGLNTFGGSRVEGPGSREDEEDILWALKDVSFEVGEGEVVGIIGRNGAGKSTLLKVLSRITEPTSGEAVLRGRVSSLLEVGTGFHPELTGRENVYMNGTILGMRKREIDRKFDEIVDFSGVEKFLDTPVKRYSSGMKVRLAFAVAAHLEPEILVIDEVLAVGDFEFQTRCLGKMQDVATGGRTVLFVSHQLGSVRELCTRAIRLDHGSITDDGIPSRVVDSYIKQFQSEGIANRKLKGLGDHRIELLAASLMNEDGIVTSTFNLDEPIEIHLHFVVREQIYNLHFVAWVQNEYGQAVFGTASWDSLGSNPGRVLQRGEYFAKCHIPPHLLNHGTYRIAVNGQVPGKEFIFKVDDLLHLSLSDIGGAGGSTCARREGIVRPILPWIVTTVDVAGASSPSASSHSGHSAEHAIN